jgi:hypothetical protein
MQQFKPLLSDEYFYLGITRLGFDNLLLEQIFHEVTETNLFWTQVVDHPIDEPDAFEV